MNCNSINNQIEFLIQFSMNDTCLRAYKKCINKIDQYTNNFYLQSIVDIKSVIVN